MPRPQARQPRQGAEKTYFKAYGFLICFTYAERKAQTKKRPEKTQRYNTGDQERQQGQGEEDQEFHLPLFHHRHHRHIRDPQLPLLSFRDKDHSLQRIQGPHRPDEGLGPHHRHRKDPGNDGTARRKEGEVRDKQGRRP